MYNLIIGLGVVLCGVDVEYDVVCVWDDVCDGLVMMMYVLVSGCVFMLDGKVWEKVSTTRT